MKKTILMLSAVAAFALPALAAPQYASAERRREYSRVDDRYERRDNRRYRNDCGRTRHRRAQQGTVTGAVVGGLLGNRIAGRGSRTEGTVLGAVVGGVAGNQIGRNRGCRR